MAHHDDDVVGKAYDARLMRRLLGYLRPYQLQAALALAAIIANSMLQLAQPYLMKVAIDRYIPAGDLAGVNRIALWFFAILVAAFALEFMQTWLLQTTGQRIMFDMRLQIYAHLRRGVGLRRRLHPGRHHDRDADDELAAGAGVVRGVAADRRDYAVVPPQRAGVVPHRAAPDRAHQRLPAGTHHRHEHGAAVPA